MSIPAVNNLELNQNNVAANEADKKAEGNKKGKDSAEASEAKGNGQQGKAGQADQVEETEAQGPGEEYFSAVGTQGSRTTVAHLDHMGAVAQAQGLMTEEQAELWAYAESLNNGNPTEQAIGMEIKRSILLEIGVPAADLEFVTQALAAFDQTVQQVINDYNTLFHPDSTPEQKDAALAGIRSAWASFEAMGMNVAGGDDMQNAWSFGNWLPGRNDDLGLALIEGMAKSELAALQGWNELSPSVALEGRISSLQQTITAVGYVRNNDESYQNYNAAGSAATDFESARTFLESSFFTVEGLEADIERTTLYKDNYVEGQTKFLSTEQGKQMMLDVSGNDPELQAILDRNGGVVTQEAVDYFLQNYDPMFQYLNGMLELQTQTLEVLINDGENAARIHYMGKPQELAAGYYLALSEVLLALDPAQFETQAEAYRNEAKAMLDLGSEMRRLAVQLVLAHIDAWDMIRAQ